LFGHEKGAFTGADRKRIGKFEQCNEGTIFLDEIGDMPLSAQAKILRLLQEQRFERVGGSESIQTRVRVLAATNQNLEQRIADGRFRKDLYYRLHIVTIEVPPLRQRREDIAELAHHFLYRYNRELGFSFQGFDPEVLLSLRDYSWPGNVRELQSVVKESMLRNTGPIILPEFLPSQVRQHPAAEAEGPHSDASGIDLAGLIDDLLRRGENNIHAQVMREVERTLLLRALQETHGHQGQASERLGLSRSTLRYKLRDLGLSIDKMIEESPAEKEGK
jgi:two-component system, NtrC family, response regulator AtoC